MYILENISSARRDLCRVQPRCRLAGKMFSHVNASDIVVKLYEAKSRLRNFPGEAGKCQGNFLHMNRPLYRVNNKRPGA